MSFATSYRDTNCGFIFHTQYGGNGGVLVNVSEVYDEVIVTKKTEGPVDYSKENKEAWDNLLFCN